MPSWGNSQLPISAPTIPINRSPIRPKPAPRTLWPASQPATMPTTRMTRRLSTDMFIARARGVRVAVKYGFKEGSPVLATRCHQTSFADYSSVAASQAGYPEVGPDLTGAFPRRRSDGKPVRLCQSHGFPGFHLRSKSGQGDDRSTQSEHHRQGREGFDHEGS